jgi:RES domain-containing protein
MLAFRLVKARQTKTAFSGEGARLAGGRWNLPGTVLVYLSESLALAALETFVHLERDDYALKFASIRVEIPDELIAQFDRELLPSDWRREPPPESAQQIGTRWAKEAGSCCLRLPSVLIPAEFNYLLHPAHPDFAKIRIADPELFSFDPCMWK